MTEVRTDAGPSPVLLPLSLRSPCPSVSPRTTFQERMFYEGHGGHPVRNLSGEGGNPLQGTGRTTGRSPIAPDTSTHLGALTLDPQCRYRRRVRKRNMNPDLLQSTPPFLPPELRPVTPRLGPEPGMGTPEPFGSGKEQSPRRRHLTYVVVGVGVSQQHS